MTRTCSVKGYAEEWKRTKPDFVVFLPAEDGNLKWHDPSFFVLNEHFIVLPIGGKELLAFWTAWGPELKFLRVVSARSTDAGQTWTRPTILDGPGSGAGDEHSACWAVPVRNRQGRIYLFYSKSTGEDDLQRGFTGMLQCRFSDDGGVTWSLPTILPMQRTQIDAPDPHIPCNWIAWRQPEVDSTGVPLVTFTRWGSPKRGFAWYSQCELMRLENLDDNPAPGDVEITWLPEKGAITVPSENNPEFSFAEEASVTPLPDGRLFLIMRTNRGAIWYTCSEDNGRTWNDTSILRYHDGGDPILQPVSPAPLFRMNDGRFLLLYNNNDGYVFGAEKRWDPRVLNRRPAFLAVGEYRPRAAQPIWFSPPKLFIDNDRIPIDIPGHVPRLDAACYPSFTELDGKRVLWYPDRKHFLLGKIISDEWLEDMKAPTAT